MIERTGGASLLFKSLQPFLVHGIGRRQHLNGHVASQPAVARAIDFAHSACAQRGDNFIGPKSCSRGDHSRMLEGARTGLRRGILSSLGERSQNLLSGGLSYRGWVVAGITRALALPR